MSKLNTQFVSAFTGILMAFVIALPASAQIPAIADTQAVHAKGVGILPPPLLPGVPLPGPAPDTDLYTTYSFYGPEYISWVVCGSTSQSEGCYDSGNLGRLVTPAPSLKAVRRSAAIRSRAMSMW
jgi:hypothetical protein